MRQLFIFPVIIMILTTGAAGQVPLDPATFWQTNIPGLYSTGMIWRDANNDGFIDVFYSNGNDMARARSQIYLSNRGTMPAAPSWQTGNVEYSGHCSVGDVDDNGFPDFAIANFLGSGRFSTKNFSVIYNNFGGLPDQSPDWYTGDSLYTFSCALGDPDGDGDLDLAFATGEPYYTQKQKDAIYFNIGGALQTLPGWQTFQPTEAMDVTWGDVDNDGDLDLAFCYDDRSPRVFYNRGGIMDTVPGWMADENESGNTLIFGDVNGDGWLDLVVAFNNQNGGYGYYRVYYNQGDGNLNATYGWQSADGGYGSAVALCDFDNDGDLDLAAGRWWDRPRVYENTGTTFTTEPVWRANNATVVEEIAWVDVDADGVESFADTILVASPKKVFYAEKSPLYALDSVRVDDVILAANQYCFNIEHGWVSLGQTPSSEIIIYYQYSYKNDLAISNWDTYNMVYGNTNRPFVDFYADTSFGWAPLTVNFSDSSVGASDYLWRFGDSDSSYEINPVYTFSDGGAHDIYLECTLPDGRHNHTERKMIITLADTLYFPKIVADVGDTVKVPIYLRNCHPLRYMVLPITYAGSMYLRYLKHDADSCRTDYFESIQLANESPYYQKLVLNFFPSVTTYQPDLAPGFGRIVNLYFICDSGSGMSTLDSTTLSNKTLLFDANYLTYQTAVKPGYISDNLLMKGDADHNGVINIRDITYLINALYKSGPQPISFEGDANGDGVVNIKDITYLINYLYKGGPPPPVIQR